MDQAAAVKLHEELLGNMPEGARHDRDICPFCVDQATSTESATSDPSRSGGTDVPDQQSSQQSTKGGTPVSMSGETNTTQLSQEAHQALLDKAVADATATVEQALATKVKEIGDLNTQVTTLTSERDEAKTDNQRLNKELDEAQAKIKELGDENAKLKTSIDDKDAAAAKAEIATKRADQVKNLGLFTDEYVAEKAASWADIAEDQWTERVEEWSKLKQPAAADDGGNKDPKTETASAMSGTGDKNLTDDSTDRSSETKTSARRAVLGLTG